MTQNKPPNDLAKRLGQPAWMSGLNEIEQPVVKLDRVSSGNQASVLKMVQDSVPSPKSTPVMAQKSVNVPISTPVVALKPNPLFQPNQITVPPVPMASSNNSARINNTQIISTPLVTTKTIQSHANAGPSTSGSMTMAQKAVLDSNSNWNQANDVEVSNTPLDRMVQLQSLNSVAGQKNENQKLPVRSKAKAKRPNKRQRGGILNSNGDVDMEKETQVDDDKAEDQMGVVATYAEYMPAKLKIGKPHPDPVVETASLSSVEPTDITYELKIPHRIYKKGALSALQLESIVYASQAHQQHLGDDSRAGFLIGEIVSLVYIRNFRVFSGKNGAHLLKTIHLLIINR